jgi:hypothetical protein
MTTMSKFLALIPVVGFAAACSGVAPTGPSQLSNNATESLSGGATTMGSACKGVTGIDLSVSDATDPLNVYIVATYLTDSTTPISCPAPQWRSDRTEMTIDQLNPFRVGFDRNAGGQATVQATSPNGISAEIEIRLGVPTRSGRNISDCFDVVGVTVSMERGASDDRRVFLVASYDHSGPQPTFCSALPGWDTQVRGLVVDSKNPFRASVKRSADTQMTVNVTGPNRTIGSITF